MQLLLDLFSCPKGSHTWFWGSKQMVNKDLYWGISHTRRTGFVFFILVCSIDVGVKPSYQPHQKYLHWGHLKQITDLWDSHGLRGRRGCEESGTGGSMGGKRGGRARCCPALFLADPYFRLESFIVLLQDRNLEFSLGKIHPYTGNLFALTPHLVLMYLCFLCVVACRIYSAQRKWVHPLWKVTF